jgi:hypothetical protein
MVTTKAVEKIDIEDFRLLSGTTEANPQNSGRTMFLRVPLYEVKKTLLPTPG